MHLLLDRLGITRSAISDDAFKASHHIDGRVLFRSIRENQVEVQSILPIPPNETDTASFLAHPKFPARLKALQNLGGRLLLNPSLASGNAYLELDSLHLLISHNAPYPTFEHEFAHLVYELELKDELDPEIRAEFAPLLDYVAGLRVDSKFSDSTFHEIFAGLHEHRVAMGSTEIPTPSADSHYMLSYLGHDLKNRNEKDLSPTEKEWKRLYLASQARARQKSSSNLVRALVQGNLIGLVVSGTVVLVQRQQENVTLRQGFEDLLPGMVVDSFDRQNYRSIFYIGTQKPEPTEKWTVHVLAPEKEGPRRLDIEVLVHTRPNGSKDFEPISISNW